MAKYESALAGNFDEVLAHVEEGILQGSASATYEAGSDFNLNNTRCAVRVFERYSILGKNRVSLTITLIGNGQDLFISAITSGGSQAVLFKLNTFGEESFLECVVDILERYKNTR